MDSMISSAARAKSELIEAKQQINVLESHSRRFASERESLYSQIEVLKVKFPILRRTLVIFNDPFSCRNRSEGVFQNCINVPTTTDPFSQFLVVYILI